MARHQRPSSRRAALWLLLGVLAACTDRRGANEECVFNDDCAPPLVCAGRRCRTVCRTDRDCPTGTTCAPSEDPRKRVCVGPAEPSLCATDVSCPPGSVCAAGSCWWRCADDGICASRASGACLRPELLCANPATVEAQRTLGGQGPSTSPPDDASTDAAMTDASGAETSVADVSGNDVAAMDAAVVDAPALDVAAMDAAMDAAVVDAPALDVAIFDVTSERSTPQGCRVDGDCAFLRAAGRCVAGACVRGTCDDGFGDCDGDGANGCETDVRSAPEHCGVCGFACPLRAGIGAARCVDGRCAIASCAGGRADCNALAGDGCETSLDGVTDCGSCGNACPATPAMHVLAARCVAGRCGYTMCAAGHADCDGLASNGCEVDLLATTTHCGACGSACPSAPNSTTACAGGACQMTCATGWADCDATPANGCERDLTSSPDHCGACGRRCGAAEVCLAGACTAFPYGAMDSTEVFAPTADITLDSGVHRFASVRIPAGVRVTVRAPGVLDIRARGPIEVLGVIDLSGGRGGDNGRTDTSCEGGNGGGGETGTTRAGANGAPGRCNAGGGSGQGFAGDAAVHVNGVCGSGGSFGGGAGGGAANPRIADFGGGGGGGGGFGGAGGGGGFGNSANSGAGGGETLGNGVCFGAFVTVQGGGNPGLSRLSGGGPLYDGARGQAAAPNVGGGGGGGGSIGCGAAADLAVTNTFRVGSGGGGGGAHGGSLSDGETAVRCALPSVAGGAGGGGGGGALRLASATLIRVPASGQLLARGGNGGDAVVFAPRVAVVGGGGAGGGGSGGAIVLVAPSVLVDGVVDTSGGAGGRAIGTTIGFLGGAGGLGRVRVSTQRARCSLSGTWVPQLVDGCTVSTIFSNLPLGRAVVGELAADLMAGRLR